MFLFVIGNVTKLSQIARFIEADSKMPVLKGHCTKHDWKSILGGL